MTSRIFKRDIMPLNPILKVKNFEVWDINFMRPFSSSFGNQYIFVVVDYMSKWVKTVPTRTNDNIVKFLKENIISHFGAPVR